MAIISVGQHIVGSIAGDTGVSFNVNGQVL